MTEPKECGNCRYWNTSQDAPVPGVGECRRRAPVVRSETSVDGVWPDTFDHEWCGEWKGKA